MGEGEGEGERGENVKGSRNGRIKEGEKEGKKEIENKERKEGFKKEILSNSFPGLNPLQCSH